MDHESSVNHRTDVVEIMENRHPTLFDSAFGEDPEYWNSASPFHSLNAATRPILAVCSRHSDFFCHQAREFAAKASGLEVDVRMLEKDCSHMETNRLLGVDQRYTRSVEGFMARLDDEVARRLRTRPDDSR